MALMSFLSADKNYHTWKIGAVEKIRAGEA
jgi:hypothetical protein